MDLTVGTRVYNHGDMANASHFGTIVIIDNNNQRVKIQPDDNSYGDRKPYWIPICMFSETYLGHGGTRFVTEKAYKEYRQKCMDNFMEKYWAPLSNREIK